MATIYVHIPGAGIISHEVPQNEPLTIGETSENSFPIKAPSISPRHAEIVAENGGYKLRDLGSANKCWVNNIAVAEQVLNDGDSVRLGRIEALFLMDSPGNGKDVEPALHGRLTLSIPGEGETIFHFNGHTTTVGWKSDNDLRIKDASVSGHHAQFLQADGKYQLKDLRSTNKTFLNGVPIVEAEVHDGDEIQFGAVKGRLNLRCGLQRVAPAKEADTGAKALASQLETFKTQAETLRKEREEFEQRNQHLSQEVQSLSAQLDQQKKADHEREKNLAAGEKAAAAALAAAQARVTELENALEASKQKAESERQETKAQIEALTGGQTGQQQKIAALTQDRDTLQQEKDRLAAQLAETQTRAEAETKAAAENARKQTEAAARLREQESTIRELKAEIDDLNRKITTAMEKRDETLSKLGNTAREHEKERAQAAETLAAAQACVTELESALEALRQKAERERQETKAQIEALSGDQTGQQQKIVALMQARDALQAEKEQLAAQLTETRTRAEAETKAAAENARKQMEAAARLQEQESAIRELKAEIEALNKKITTAVETRDETLSKLETTTRELEKERAQAAETLAAAQARVTELESALKAAQQKADSERQETKAQIEALSSDQTGQQQKIAALTQARDTLQQEKDQLAAQLAEAKAKAEAETKAAAESARNQTEAAARLQEQENTIGQLKAQIEALSGDQTGQQQKIAALTQDRDTLQQEKERLAAQLAEAKAEAEAAIKERDSLQAAAQQQKQAAASQPQGPANPPVVEPMPTLKMPGMQSPAPQAPAPAAMPAAPGIPKLSLAKEEPLPPAVDPRHSLIEIAPPSQDPGIVSARPLPLFNGVADLKKIMETAPETLNSMRRSLHAFIKNQMETSLLDEFQVGLHSLTEATLAAQLTPMATLSSALEMLVDDLKKIPGQINPSSLRTVSQAVDFLVTLTNEKNLALTKDPSQARLFAVDDDPDARKTILAALETINLRVSSATDAKGTLEALNKEQFDLVLIDVGLPEINGFELCTRLRRLSNYKKVPVVFITGAVTVQNRVQSSLSGGNDFIAKPFNLLELGVKALIWILKGQIGLV